MQASMASTSAQAAQAKASRERKTVQGQKRKSCAYCRSRKARCIPSDDDPERCIACIKKGKECVHEIQSVMGRPKKNRTEESMEGSENSSANRKSRSKRGLPKSEPSTSPDGSYGRMDGTYNEYDASRIASFDQHHFGHEHPLQSSEHNNHYSAPWLEPFAPYTAHPQAWHLPPPVAQPPQDDPFSVDTIKLQHAESLPTVTQAFDQQKVENLANAFWKLLGQGVRPDSPPAEPDKSAFIRTMIQLGAEAQPPRHAWVSPSPPVDGQHVFAISSRYWSVLSINLVSLSTKGGFSSSIFVERPSATPSIVGLLMADRSPPSLHPASEPVPQSDPTAVLSEVELRALLTIWFSRSRYSFILNDCIFLRDLELREHDPALLNAMVAMALSFCSPADLTSRPFWPTASQCIAYAESLLFARVLGGSAHTLSTAQAMWIIGEYEGANLRIRRHWLYCCISHCLLRDLIKFSRQRNPASSSRHDGPTRAEVEQELLSNTCWAANAHCVMCFFAMGLDPQEIGLEEVMDRLALPPRDPAAYKSINYRASRAPRLPGIENNLFVQLKAFAETIRVVDLIYLTTSKNSNLAHYLAADPNLANPFPKNSLSMIGNGDLSAAGISNVRIAQFLVNMARESAMSSVRLRQQNERSYQMSAQSESFLAGTCSILALHRLKPFGQAVPDLAFTTTTVRIALDALQSIVTAASSVKDLDLLAVHSSECSKVLQLLSDALPSAFQLVEMLEDSFEDKESLLAALSQATELTLASNPSLYYLANVGERVGQHMRMPSVSGHLTPSPTAFISHSGEEDVHPVSASMDPHSSLTATLTGSPDWIGAPDWHVNTAYNADER